MPVSPLAPRAADDAPSAVLLPELREKVASYLNSQDLFAVSQVSHAWRAAALPNWEGAYGAKPCHQPAGTPAAWRLAVMEKNAYEAQLLAPKSVKPAELAARAPLLARSVPLTAFIALQAGGAAAQRSASGLPIVLARLYLQGRKAEAQEFALDALSRDGALAKTVMDAAVLHKDLRLGRAALAAGAAKRALWHQFRPCLAVAARNEEYLRLCLEVRDVDAPAPWNEALGWAVEGKAYAMAEAILEHGLATCVNADFSFLEPAEQRRYFDLLHKRYGLCMAGSLLKTAATANPAAKATGACRLLADEGLRPEMRQDFLDRHCAELLASARSAFDDSVRQLRRLLDLGGHLPKLAEYAQQRLAHHAERCSCEEVMMLLAAGVAPETPYNGTTLLRYILKNLERWTTFSKSYAEMLGFLGIRLSPSEFGLALHLACVSSFDPGTLRSLLAIGLDPNAGGILLFAAHEGRLAAVQALIEGGADVALYDDTFRTAIDVTTHPETTAYLEHLGLRRTNRADAHRPVFYDSPAS